jgi:antitoxin VapB
MAESANGKKKMKKGSDPVDAKLFWNGRSQAVRLPKEFRFEGEKVKIRRVEGGVLLESVPAQPTGVAALRAAFARIDEILGDFPFPERDPQSPAPIREYFD